MAPLRSGAVRRDEPGSRRALSPAGGLAMGELRRRDGYRRSAAFLRRELDAPTLLGGRRGRSATTRALRRLRARLRPLLTTGVCPGTDTGVGATLGALSVVGAELVAQDFADLADRAARAEGLAHRHEQVAGAARGRAHVGERVRSRVGAPLGADAREAL